MRARLLGVSSESVEANSQQTELLGNFRVFHLGSQQAELVGYFTIAAGLRTSSGICRHSD
jgi:hypothetical protein